MNPWIIILLVSAGAVFGLDSLFRRTKWKNHSREEKISLLVHMFSAGPYIFLSALGALWGIVPSNPKTAFGSILYDATIIMGETFFIAAIAAAIGSFILRKKEKIKASIWIHVIAFAYIVLVLAVNSLAGKIM